MRLANARRWRGWFTAGTVVGAVVVSGCGSGDRLPADTPTQRVGAWRIGTANRPDLPHVGENTLIVGIRDSAGNPMRGTVEVIVTMPQMGAMAAMESRGKVRAARSGIFNATYALAMGGEWDVTVRLHPAGGAPAEARYRLSTSIRGLAFSGGTKPQDSPAAAAMPAEGEPADSDVGAVTIDAARRQALGIRTEPVQVRELSTTLRAPGRVAFDEAHQAEIAPKFGGWVRELSASVTGQPVRRGQVLFTVYSPELWSAQREYLEAARAARVDHGKEGLGTSSADLAQAARTRLTLWDLSAEDIDEIAKRDKPLAAVPFRSPVSGVITEKNVVQGSAFQAAQILFRVARLDPIWIIASVPQQDAGFVRAGMAAKVSDPYQGHVARSGRVSFVYPSLDSLTRTAEVRIEAANADGRLRPGTFVDVELAPPLLRRLAVPESAVLPTGERSVVFVDLGDGRLAPREVQLGSRAGGYYEVLSGLRAGEVVVTSGNFLVAAESKLRSAAQKW